MFLLTVRTCWEQNGDIECSIQKQIAFSSLEKVEDYIESLPKEKGRSIDVKEFTVDSYQDPITVKDLWWCE
jgi:hypothetical protein